MFMRSARTKRRRRWPACRCGARARCCSRLSGFFSGLTGILLLGYTEYVFVGAGDQYMLPSIIAVVIGGTSLAGGSGGYVGTMAGAVVLILLQSILTTLNIPPFGRQIIFGVTLLGLMLLYGRQRRLRG